jgi:hypothetical protein
VLQKGSYTVYIGGGQPDDRTAELTGVNPIAFKVII